MESFKPIRIKINVLLSLFIVVISALFVWSLYAGAEMLLIPTSKSMDGSRIDLAALGIFSFDGERGTIKDLPARCRMLDGQKVTREGFMFSPGGRARVRDFELVGPYKFNGPPQLSCLMVTVNFA